MSKHIAVLAVIVALAVPAVAIAQEDTPDGPILFTKVDVFDGVNETLTINRWVI